MSVLAFKKITIVLMPEGANKVKQFTIPGVLLLVSLLLFVFSAAYFSWIIGNYEAMRARMPLMAQLQKENDQQGKQFLHLAQRVNQINRKMLELKEFDCKLRIMVNQEPSDDNMQFLAVGGSNHNLLLQDYSTARNRQDLVQLTHLSLDNLDHEITIGKQDKAELHKFMENQKILLASTPSIWPTKGWLSSRFGYRKSPFTGEREFHKGIDIAARKSAPIVSPADGIVSVIGWDHGFGKTMYIKHGYGLVTIYGHLEKILVKKGQHVKRREKIALVGNTGRSTGPHLHYEIRLNGVAVNPFSYILN